MKRFFALLLLLVLLLCACDGTKVPVYEPSEGERTSQTEESSVPVQTTENPQAYLHSPSGEKLLRLTRFYSFGEQYCTSGNTLQSYDPELDRWQTLCGKENCPHVDENCNAWIGFDFNGLYFAVEDNMAYCIYGTSNQGSSYLLDMEFFTLDLNTGERRSYHKLSQTEGKEIVLCDAVICADMAILNYDIVDEYEYPVARESKEHFLLAFDLTEGSMTAIMERTLNFGELYDLWGVSEDHIILAYHHSTGGLNSFGYQEHTSNYADYAMSLHRWVLMEYPIAENAGWSEQVAEWTVNSELGLFSYSSFYGGNLYYVLNDTVRAYDLQSHQTSTAFSQEGITYLCCYDGRIFYETEAGEYFWYELASGTAAQCLKDVEKIFFPLGESQDYFYGRFVSSWEDAGEKVAQYYLISKEDFYKENLDAAILLPY